MSMAHSTFNVTRQEPELVRPAKVTPGGLKELSIIDELLPFRKHTSFIQFYKRPDFVKRKNLANVIKEAISQALVYYYPLAGRLKEIGCGKTMIVDCTGEGVLFVEADSDSSLDDFGDVIHPPFHDVDELLFYPMPDSVIACPLLHFQVTRLKCGGFILATIFTHVMADGMGVVQFLRAISEMARGLPTPSVQPVWQRDLLRARVPPQVTFKHHEFDKSNAVARISTRDEKLVEYTFLFDPHAVSSLRQLIEYPNVSHLSTFELISSITWRARTLSLKLDPTVVARFMFMVNARNKFDPAIPIGYYGNVVCGKVAMSTVGELMANPIKHAVDLIRKTKEEVSEEYLRSMIDYIALHGLLPIDLKNTWVISDIRCIGLNEIDYGWGKPAYGGFAIVNDDIKPGGILSILVPLNNQKGENIGIGMPITLPEQTMNSFVNELNVMMGPVADGRTWKKTSPTFCRWTNL